MKAVTRSAGVLVLRRGAGQWHCLVLRAYRNWDVPKGLPEAGEEMLGAAVRETTEETGLSALEFAWGTAYCETPPYGRGKIVRLYLALSPSGDVHLPVSAELGRPEHHEFRWVTFEQALALLPERFHPALEWARGTVNAGPVRTPSPDSASGLG